MTEILDRLEFVNKEDGSLYVGAIFDVADETGKRRYSLEPVALELDNQRLSTELIAKVKEYQADKVKALSDENVKLKAELEAAQARVSELKAQNAELIAALEAL